MHAQKVSHKLLEKTCSWMHAARRNVLQVSVLAAIDERRLSVTGLGRAVDSNAKEKNCIKRADHLIGNEHLHAQFREVYSAFSSLIIGSVKRPVILVDWSDLDPKKKHFLLRASAAVDGRSLSLYEEVHELDTKEKPEPMPAFVHPGLSWLRSLDGTGSDDFWHLYKYMFIYIYCWTSRINDAILSVLYATLHNRYYTQLNIGQYK